MTNALSEARELFQAGSWPGAFAQLTRADHEAALEAEDIERLAVAAHMLGKDATTADTWVRAYHWWLGEGNSLRASWCASRLSFTLLVQGEQARSGGWLERANGLLEANHDCLERGYALLVEALQHLNQGEPGTSLGVFERLTGIGERFSDRDLATFGQLGMGQSLIHLGKTKDGMAKLDQAMVAVTAGELSPTAIGTVYCAVIGMCQAMFDLNRAREWTTALNRWCDSQQGLVMYRDQCLVHRAEIMQLRGAWSEALEEARRACTMLEQATAPLAAGAAFYQQGEVHRLRGEFEQAEEAYRNANQRGHEPQPGLALLRLAQGQADAAAAAMRLMMEQRSDRFAQCKALPAHIEVMLAVGDTETARDAVGELRELARSIDAPFVHAQVLHMDGAVSLSEGDARSALPKLRQAWSAWQELEMPYEAARVRLLVGNACRDLGDEETAEMEYDAAIWVFQQLGADHDLRKAEALSRSRSNERKGGLTTRELEVLRLVADGKTNPEIADQLFLSEHTVRRHLQNVFAKLDVSSRAAATAYAYQHKLL